MRNILIMLGLICSILCFGACTNKTIVTRSDFVFNTVATISLYGNYEQKVLDESFEYMRELESMMNVFSESSAVSQINDNAGIKPVVVPKEVFEVLESGQKYNEITNGIFALTSQPLIKLWNIGAPEVKSPPSSSEINAAKELVDDKKLILNSSTHEVYLTEKGMSVNLGALVKGYVADEIKKNLKNKGVTHGIINLGGNNLLLGGKSSNESFNIGIAHPDASQSEPIGMLQLTDQSIVTSGDSQRFFEDENGVVYHHLINVLTGYPEENNLRQVTIISKDSLDGDGLSTSLFFMGEKLAIEYLKSQSEILGILITKDNRVVISSELKSTFVLLDRNYEVVNLNSLN